MINVTYKKIVMNEDTYEPFVHANVSLVFPLILAVGHDQQSDDQRRDALAAFGQEVTDAILKSKK